MEAEGSFRKVGCDFEEKGYLGILSIISDLSIQSQKDDTRIESQRNWPRLRSSESFLTDRTLLILI